MNTWRLLDNAIYTLEPPLWVLDETDKLASWASLCKQSITDNEFIWSWLLSNNIMYAVKMLYRVQQKSGHLKLFVVLSNHLEIQFEILWIYLLKPFNCQGKCNSVDKRLFNMNA